jgi:hypothetical protein
MRQLVWVLLASASLTINSLGLELVKCGSIDLGITKASSPAGLKLLRAKADGTSLFMFSWNHIVVVVPFVKTFRIIPRSTETWRETNQISDQMVDGVREVKYAQHSTSVILINDIHTPFATANQYGYLNYKRSIYNDNGWTEVTMRGEQVSFRKLTDGGSTNRFFFEKVKHEGGVVQSLEVSSDDYFNSNIDLQNSFEGQSSNPEFRPHRKIVIPKSENGLVNFYLVTDPDLFPDTALGSPRIEGGSATFNVTTSSEEPVEIQSSNDLKVWKRIQSLENSNGRSVTLPMGSDKEFLRLVEP